jgi:hypothetical protein
MIAEPMKSESLGRGRLAHGVPSGPLVNAANLRIQEDRFFARGQLIENADAIHRLFDGHKNHFA